VKGLLVSGHAEDALGREGQATDGFALLPRPFVPGDLAQAVRAVLDGTGTAATDGQVVPSMTPRRVMDDLLYRNPSTHGDVPVGRGTVVTPRTCQPVCDDMRDLR
jgi:hypothetical protein